MKLALGTVQFGMNYGVANESGQVKISEVTKLIRMASECGIDMLDTAISYGDSERVLGSIGINKFNVVTKLPALSNSSCANIENCIKSHIESSLARLKVDSLYGLLIHKTDDLHGKYGKEIVESLKSLKRKGLIHRIGISIYSPKELEAIDLKELEINIVQSPFNILDRRLEQSGWLQRLHNQKIEVHARSVFLQGLLILPIDKIPEKFLKWRLIFEKWHKLILDNNISPVRGCLNFVSQNNKISRLIVGFDNSFQLQEVIKIFNNKKLDINIDFGDVDEELINPMLW